MKQGTMKENRGVEPVHLKMRHYCRRQEAYLSIGVIANQQAQQINPSAYQDDTRSNERDTAPPLIKPS
uniref:Uncharacterized protein n=1 Tax=Arundo donax TaxID=35708 RepID=A0A0A9CW60_ARUDO